MSDYVEVVTDFGAGEEGAGFTGSLLVELAAQMTLAEGAILGPDLYEFPVVDGVAKASNGTDPLKLPITEDSEPAQVPLYLSLVDVQGRKRQLPPIPYVPREDGPLNLNDIIAQE